MFSSNPLWLIILAAAVAMIPILVGILTSYVKINIILNFLKSGLGAQQVPGNLVIMALSLALTAYIMAPVISKTVAIGETIDMKTFSASPQMSDLKKLTPLFDPWQEFMTKHAGPKEIAILTELAKRQEAEAKQGASAANSETAPVENPVAETAATEVKPETAAPVDAAPKGPSVRVVIPAFVLTEIKASFMMGFMVLLPFLVIDLVVANVLTGMGMHMLSPVIVSLPLKLILFVLADGWLLITKGIIQSY